MNSKTFFTLLGALLSVSIASADTIIPSGYVSGTWTLAGSPYLVQGNISVHADSTLNIQPGVQVNFQGNYTFTVNGFLEAIGTQDDSIRFAGTATWSGVNFTNAPDTSHLVYCCLNNAYTPVTCNNSNPVISHSLMTSGGIVGAIYVPNPSCPRISDCIISNASRGIYWASSANATIDNCIISNVGYQGLWWNSSASGTISGCVISGCGRSGVFKTAGNLTFIGCTISNNNNDLDNYGGGIRSQSGNVNFIDCTISNDTTYTGEGGGVGCYNGTATFTNCTINGNYSQDLSSSPYIGGGGISLYNANAILSYCTLFDNWAVPHGGAISIYNSGNLSIDHCTIDGNEADCGMYPGSAIVVLGSSTTADITNSIISNNYSWTSSGRAIYTEGTLTVEYSDFYHNYPGGDISGNIPTGFGIFDTTNYNGDSCDIYYNVFMDPLYEDQPAGNLQITWANFPDPDTTQSPCIDAGDPASPLDPDSTIADMGCYFFDQSVTPPPVSVTLTPVNPPIVIPRNGGSFNFNASALRAVGPQALFTVWARIKNPDGTYTNPTLGPININPPVGITVTRQRTQNVPGSWVSGVYTYLGYANTSYAYPALDSSSFAFTKSAAAVAGAFITEAICCGEPFPGEEAVNYQPSFFSFQSCRPNPFNVSTAISYKLQAASHVSLKVYNTSGRLVATLAEGWREAGVHGAAFDGTGLASGIYFAKLTSSNRSATQKLVLMK